MLKYAKPVPAVLTARPTIAQPTTAAPVFSGWGPRIQF